MAYANEFGSGINLTSLMIPTQAATVFAAQEASLYLPGILIPMVQVNDGSASAQIAKMGSVAAQTITNNGDGSAETDPGADISTILPSNTAINLNLDLIAARSVIRDLGRADFNDFGRILGNSIAAAVDARVSANLGALTVVAPAGGVVTLLDDLYNAIGTIRNAGETGPLNCVVAAAKYGDFMKVIGNAGFAGSETQNAAMRSGFIGTIAGTPCYVSSAFNATNTGLTTPDFAVFSQDAVRLATQGGVKVEFERQAAAVGTNIVASIAFANGVIDTTRGVTVGTA
tara:strand:- start:133 stop:990 length:858 start_codon:yes stop_codon:yes gene_type:complete